jgi:hypothetical protein
MGVWEHYPYVNRRGPGSLLDLAPDIGPYRGTTLYQMLWGQDESERPFLSSAEILSGRFVADGGGLRFAGEGERGLPLMFDEFGRLVFPGLDRFVRGVGGAISGALGLGGPGGGSDGALNGTGARASSSSWVVWAVLAVVVLLFVTGGKK